MYKRVKQYIITNNMPVEGNKVLVALSGGADSVCMLSILQKLSVEMEFQIEAAHLNHMLRGEESSRDLNFCKILCDKLEIPLHFGECDVATYAKEKGLSIEDAGRKVRYSFLHYVKQEVNAQLIATAHNKNDLAESVMLHLMRGSGIEGLRGIFPMRQDGIIRPILDIERTEVEEYCQENNLEYVTDSTNDDTAYTRNRVRKLLLPLMQSQFNPDIVGALSRLSQICGDDSDFINARAEGYNRLIEFDEESIFIDISQLTPLHPSISRRLIIEMSKRCGVGLSFDLTSKILDLAQANKTGKEFSTGGIIFWVSYGRLYASKPMPKLEKFEYKFKMYEEIEISEVNARANATVDIFNEGTNNIRYFDLSLLKEDICIRNRRDGDTITLENGTKKLKEFFIDEKIPRHKRDAIPLLAVGNNILWIMGIRGSATFKPQKDGSALKITYKGVSMDAQGH